MLIGQVDLPLDKIAGICRKYQVRELSLFGSALRDDFRPERDVDLLVDFLPHHTVGMIEYAACQMDLAETLGRDVDLVDKKSLKKFIRREVVDTARIIYAA